MGHVIAGWLIYDKTQLYTARGIMDEIILEGIIRSFVFCFIMMSGFLLLNPNKKVDIKKHIYKMLCILGIFGFTYCLIENIIAMGFSNIPKLLYMSVFNLIQEKSWGHMWYIYTLIGLYVITPILKKFIESADMNTAKLVLGLLFITTMLIPTINQIFNIEITTFDLGPLNYIFIYLLGYYIVCTELIKEEQIYIGGGIGLLGCSILGYFCKIDFRTNVFVLLEAIAIVKLFSSGKINIKNNVIINCISKYSLGIYLVHTFWLNLLNKGFSIYPKILPSVIGEIVFLLYALIMSIFSCFILYRLPIMKKLLK